MYLYPNPNYFEKSPENISFFNIKYFYVCNYYTSNHMVTHNISNSLTNKCHLGFLIHPLTWSVNHIQKRSVCKKVDINNFDRNSFEISFISP